jgi:hypothetical protein
MGLVWSGDACLIVRDYEGLQNQYYFEIFHFLEFIITKRPGNRVRFRHTV